MPCPGRNRNRVGRLELEKKGKLNARHLVENTEIP